MASCARAGRIPVTRRTALGLTAGAAVSLATGTGCGAGGNGGGTKTLNVACEGGGRAQLQPIAELFQQETGGTVNLVEFPYAGLFNRLTGELGAGRSSFDVCAIDSVWIPLFSDKLHPLDHLFTADVQADLFPALLHDAKVDGHFLGMPAWTNTEVLLYRKDLFDDKGEQAAFADRYGYPLAPPKTWRQFTEIAAYFTRPDRKLYGTDVKGSVETEWLAHALQAGSPGVVLDDNGTVIVDNDQHVAALQFHAELHNRHRVAPPGASQTDWNAAQNLFHQGSTAMTRFWAHAYRQIPEDSKIAGKVGVAPMIAGSAGIAGVLGPWYLCVPRSSTKRDLAERFVAACFEHNALGLHSSLGLAARRSSYERYADTPGYEAFRPLLTTLDAAATRPRPATPRWQRIVDSVLIPTVQRSLGPRVDYAQLLTSARARIEGILA
jgi:multiple sugar transport system substrate-binding protein